MFYESKGYIYANQNIIDLTNVSFLLASQLNAAGYLLGNRKYHGQTILLMPETEEKPEVLSITGSGSPIPWYTSAEVWHFDIEKRIISTGLYEVNRKNFNKIKNMSHSIYYLTADEQGHVTLSNKKSEYSEWLFDDKGTHGDSGSRWFIISNKKAPKGLKYLTVDVNETC